MIRRLIRWAAIRTGRGLPLFQMAQPTHLEVADWWRRRGATIGPGTTINRAACLMDAQLVSIGANCSVSDAIFVTHSGGDRILRHRYPGQPFDSTAAIVVGDNCIIGSGARIRYGVRIGSDCVVAMGAVVVRDLADGMIQYSDGRLGRTIDYVQRLSLRSQKRILV